MSKKEGGPEAHDTILRIGYKATVEDGTIVAAGLEEFSQIGITRARIQMAAGVIRHAQGKKGPTKVNSEAYKDNYTRIFGNKDGSSANN